MIFRIRSSPIAAIGRAFILFMFLPPFISSPVYPESKGTAGASFLKLGVGARALGMGEAASAVATSVEALYWNPAGLGDGDRPTLMATYHPLVEGLQYNQAAVAFRAGKIGFGAGVSGVSQPSIDAYDTVGNKTGTFSAADQLIIGGFGVGGEAFRVGAAVRFISSRIDGVSAGATAGDAGIRFRNPWLPFWSHAVVARNFGGKLQFIRQEDPLPAGTYFGNAIRLGSRGLLAADIGQVKGTGGVFAAGLEWLPWVRGSNTVALRGGYASRRNEADELSGASFGAGLGFKWLTIDYAWLPFGELGDAHAVTLVWRIPVIDRSRSPRRSTLRNRVSQKEERGESTKPAEPTRSVMLTLDTGKQVWGEIVEETDKRVVLKSNGRTISIRKSDIVKTERFQPTRRKRLGLE